MTKTTKTSQITESEVLEESAEEIKTEGQPAEQPIAEASEPAPEPEQTKLEEAQPAEAEAAE